MELKSGLELGALFPEKDASYYRLTKALLSIS
jgi:hypothetical protein